MLVVVLTFGSPGLMKFYLTLRTANAWVHLWGYHAITPHVTGDTPMIVDIFRIARRSLTGKRTPSWRRK